MGDVIRLKMGKNEAQSEGVDSYKMQKITPFSTEDRRTVGMKGEVHTKCRETRSG